MKLTYSYISAQVCGSYIISLSEYIVWVYLNELRVFDQPCLVFSLHGISWRTADRTANTTCQILLQKIKINYSQYRRLTFPH